MRPRSVVGEGAASFDTPLRCASGLLRMSAERCAKSALGIVDRSAEEGQICSGASGSSL